MSTAIIQLFLSILSSIQNKKIVLGIKVSMLTVLFVISVANGEVDELLKAVLDNIAEIASC